MAEKKQRKPKKQVQPHVLYEGSKKKSKNCPKCGPGNTLAAHKDRETCGKCGYTTFKSKESSDKK